MNDEEELSYLSMKCIAYATAVKDPKLKIDILSKASTAVQCLIQNAQKMDPPCDNTVIKKEKDKNGRY